MLFLYFLKNNILYLKTKKKFYFFYSPRKVFWNKWTNCKFSSNAKSGPPLVETIDGAGSVLIQPSLSEPLPGIPKAIYSTTKEQQFKTQVTTLPNGLRVASEKRMGQFCTIGGIFFSKVFVLFNKFILYHCDGAIIIFMIMFKTKNFSLYSIFAILYFIIIKIYLIKNF